MIVWVGKIEGEPCFHSSPGLDSGRRRRSCISFDPLGVWLQRNLPPQSPYFILILLVGFLEKGIVKHDPHIRIWALAGVHFSCVSRVTPVSTIGVWTVRIPPPQSPSYSNIIIPDLFSFVKNSFITK